MSFSVWGFPLARTLLPITSLGAYKCLSHDNTGNRGGGQSSHLVSPTYTLQRIRLVHPDSQRCDSNKRGVISKRSNSEKIANSMPWEPDREDKGLLETHHPLV